MRRSWALALFSRVVRMRIQPTRDAAPCKGGITHNNAELCTKGDLEPGLNVLLHTVMARADR